MTARARRFPLALDRVGGAAGTPGGQGQAGRGAAQRRTPVAGTPTGLGLDSQAVRERMVQRLRDDGVRCEPVLVAMSQVPRHEFVDAALAAQGYEDTALPIGHGQTISKPSVVARMLALLFEARGAAHSTSLGRVLEIGTGCGYQAALLSLLAQQVISVERLRPLFDRARGNLAPLRRDNLRLVYGDGRAGHAPNAPYDSIICAASADEVPEAWLEQMAIGARLIAPMRSHAHAGQELLVVDRNAQGWSRLRYEAVHFVPLRSGIA
jgi:protein-L-isoaspartate(D-aspartate) O-methyltransferase